MLQPDQPAVQFLMDSGVDDAVQALPLPLVRRRRRRPASVRSMAESSPRIPDPEVFHDLPVGRLAGKDDLVGHVVGIDAVDSQLAELVQDKALAAGDPTRESDLEHGKMIAAR